MAFVLCGLVSLAVGLWLRPERGGWLQLALGAAACVAGAQSLAQALIMAGRGRGGSLSAFGDRLRLHHAGGADDLRWESVTHLYQGDDGRPVLVISDRRIRLDSSAGAERIASAARAALDWRNCAQRRLENIPEGALSLAEDRPPECLDRGLSRIEHSTE